MATETDTETELRFLRPKAAAALTGYTYGHLLALSRQGKFPPVVAIGDQGVAFIESEVKAWMVERVAERDAKLAASA